MAEKINIPETLVYTAFPYIGKDFALRKALLTKALEGL